MNTSTFNNSAHPDVGDVEFFLNEIVRHIEMKREELFRLPLTELISSVRHPSGRGSLICGEKAKDRLLLLAERIIKREKQTGRIRSQSLQKALEEVIIRRFVEDDADLTSRDVSKCISAALKITYKNKKSRKILLPCYVGNDQPGATISLGPVEIRPSEELSALVDEALRVRSLEEHTSEGEGPSLFDKLSENFNNHVKECGHFAIVYVDNCDYESALSIAEMTIQSAIDSLMLLIGSSHSNFFDMNRRRGETTRDTMLVMNESHVENIGTKISWNQNTLKNDWWSDLRADEGEELIQKIGQSIRHSSATPSPTSMAQRITDAINWYAQGSREKSHAAKIIKYVTALERLVITRKLESDIAATFIGRVASLYYSPDRHILAKVKKDVSQLYNMRSKLLHGSHSPSGSSLGPFVRLGEEIAREAIQSFLLHVPEEVITSRLSEQDNMEAFFVRHAAAVGLDGARAEDQS